MSGARRAGARKGAIAATDPAAKGAAPRGGLRMAELCARSGVARETIHFYLREGLLPRPRKGGRTIAYYDEEHLERLRTIRRLREEKYLPLAVIRRLLASPAAAAERDVDALAEVLKIDPTLAAPGPARAPSPAAVEEALARGLLGRGRGAPAAVGADPSEARVLAVVEEALALAEPARELTLRDLAVCADDVSRLVAREAELFFDRVLDSADPAGSIAALRAGRGTVARFITAHRDFVMRRIVEDLLAAIQGASGLVSRARDVPLSDEALVALGAVDHRRALERRADDEASRALVWLDFAQGAAGELARAGERPGLGRVEAALVAWGAHESVGGATAARGLEEAAREAGGSSLAAILAAEAQLVRALRRKREAGASLLDQAVPAIHRLLAASPMAESAPLAQALAAFHRARVELVLPAVLGHKARGAAAMEHVLALAAALDEGGITARVAAARIAANAHLLLGRELVASDAARARAHLDAALGVDPRGPIDDAVRAERGAGGV